VSEKKSEKKPLSLVEKWFPAKSKLQLSPKGAQTAKGFGLAAGGMLHSKGGESRTIIACFTCKKPLWIIWPLIVLSKFSTFQKPATPIGHKWSLEDRTKNRKVPDFTCPLCKGNFAKFNAKQNSAQYLTDKGIM
jgi:hypothetical protein